MKTLNFDPLLAVNELRGLLRRWRETRGKSQFDLSLDTGISQRHISFIESGRSVPSRETLMGLAQALDVPLRERNTLLLAAGYAPMYSESAWDSQEMQIIMHALKRVLRQNEPFPAVVMDRYWNVLMTNEAAPRFFGRFVDLATRPGPRNLLRLMFDPDGLRPFIVNWENVARSLLQRVYRESIGRVIDQPTKDLIDGLLAFPGVANDWKMPQFLSDKPGLPFTPVIPISFSKDGKVWNLFSMITTVGTPQTVAAQEMRIESMYPMDEDTEGLG